MIATRSPTPQAISALLKRAGLPRSERVGSQLGAPVMSEGFSVRRSTFQPPAAADVRYRADDQSFAMSDRPGLDRCAEVIQAAGWEIADRRYKLVVLAAASPEEN